MIEPKDQTIVDFIVKKMTVVTDNMTKALEENNLTKPVLALCLSELDELMTELMTYSVKYIL